MLLNLEVEWISPKAGKTFQSGTSFKDIFDLMYIF